jgi:flagellar biosynthesis/type III secretory pathway protein FliH
MAKMGIAPKDRPKVKFGMPEVLASLKLDKARSKLISGFVETYLKLNAAEQKEFEVEIKSLEAEETEEVMEIVTSWMKEGIKQGRKEARREGREKGQREGRKEGRQEGRISEAQENIIEILAVRFKAVPAELKKTLKTIEDGPRLKALLRQAATTPNLREFTRRLAEPK